MLVGENGDVPIMPIYWYTYIQLERPSPSRTRWNVNLLDQTDLTKVKVTTSRSHRPTAGGRGRERSARPFVHHRRPRGRGTDMTKFVVRRIVWTIPVILLVILMTFVMMRQIKGNPFRKSERAIPADPGEPRARSSGSTSRGTSSTRSTSRASSRSTSARRSCCAAATSTTSSRSTSRVSLELGGLALLFALVFGIPLGVIAALRANSSVDYAAMFFSNVGFAVPSFLVATLLIYFFALQWGDISACRRAAGTTWQ